MSTENHDKYTMKRSLALLGAGNWGKNLARNFHELGVLHTLCDTKPAILETYKKYEGVTLTTDWNSVLKNPEIDKVVIAAPAIMHYELAKQALNSGKDLFVEKPLCLTSREGEELITLAEEKGCILMVGHLLQYHPYVRQLQQMLAAGDLGKLQYIVSNRLNLGSIRTEENALWNFAPHDISVILSLCGHRLPDQVRCTGGAYISKGIADTTLTTMRFSDEVRAHIYVSWLNPFKEQKLVVVGSAGMAVFDDTKPWEEKLLLYRNHIKWSDGVIPHADKKESEAIIIPVSEPLRDECLHFLRCCEERITPRTDGHEGLRVLKVLQAAQDSLNEDGEAKNPVAQHRLSGEKKAYFAHSSAIVDPLAMIGEGSKIWHFSHIMADAKLGTGCNIGQNVVVSSGVTLGQNVKVQNNVSIYTGVVCEDDVFLGPSCVFTNVINPRSGVSRRGEYQQTLLKRGVTIGANATIVCGIEIGEYAFIGAGAVVVKDVLPYALIVGNPGKQIGWMSQNGQRLNLPVSIPKGEMLKAECPATGEIYCLAGKYLEGEGEKVNHRATESTERV